MRLSLLSEIANKKESTIKYPPPLYISLSVARSPARLLPFKVINSMIRFGSIPDDKVTKIL